MLIVDKTKLVAARFPGQPRTYSDGSKSLPLDRPRRLAGDVVGHPVDAAHLVDDPPGDAVRNPASNG